VDRLLPLLLTFLATTGTVAAPAERVPVDLLLTDTLILTQDEDRPRAQALAVLDGRIVGVGSSAELRSRFEGPEYALPGATVLPGFHDAHSHPLSGGRQLLGCDLGGILERDRLLDAVRTCLERDPSAGWLLGRGWELSIFPKGNAPAALLDALAPERPVALEGADGHSTWVNGAALRRAGISADTPDPPNGVIERDGDGAPSGTLRESAQNLLDPYLPEADRGQLLEALRAAQSHAHSLGITSLIDAAVGPEEISLWRELEARGELQLRVRGSLDLSGSFSGEADRRELHAVSEPPGTLLRLDSAKLFLDGVLEGETAALLEPYASDGRGNLNLPWEALEAEVVALDAAGVQLHMHAIGDAAVRQGLGAIAAARAANGPRDNRHTLCHLQLIDAEDIPRFAELDVTANFQALWAYPDAYVTDINLPALGAARVRRMYPIASVHRAGGRVVGGSDWPVSDMNPLPAIETALTRRDPDGRIAEPLNEAEAVDLPTMLAAYTREAAWLMHQERQTGRIRPGYLADLVVLDGELTALPAEAIGEVRVRWTIFEGRTVHGGPDAAAPATAPAKTE